MFFTCSVDVVYVAYVDLMQVDRVRVRGEYDAYHSAAADCQTKLSSNHKTLLDDTRLARGYSRREE